MVVFVCVSKVVVKKNRNDIGTVVDSHLPAAYHVRYACFLEIAAKDTVYSNSSP